MPATQMKSFDFGANTASTEGPALYHSKVEPVIPGTAATSQEGRRALFLDKEYMGLWA